MADTASSKLKSAMDKHSSLKNETIANNNGDLISRLPDAVLCHILSFVPTKNAVATSVLSKRWKLLWTSVPNLDFSIWYPSFEPTTKFMKFVDRVLRENNVSRVRKVHLHCNRNCNPSRVKVWTNAIAWRDAEYFDLKLPLWCLIKNPDEISSIISLPDSFFSRHQNLVELRLQIIGLKVPTSVDFPSLETISFVSVQFLDDDSMKNLLSGCPILKSLHIRRSEWDNAQTLYICSASLGDLLLHTIKCTNKDFGYKVVIDAPNLSRLTLTDHVGVDYDMNDLSSLKEVYVSVEPARIVHDEEFYAKRLFDLLRNISHLEDLILSACTIRFLENTNFVRLPMFNNLTHLKVELLPNCWPILPYLLNCSPNLVSFYIALDHISPYIEWHEPQNVPKCLLSNLEEIQFELVQDYDAVMEMIIYFLNNAMVLKKMDITSIDFDLDQETNIRIQLLEFPRSGSNCQIEYYNQKFPMDVIEWLGALEKLKGT